MERAGAGLARARRRRSRRDGPVAVVCGKGNNGGDGSSPRGCCARPGREVDVLALGPSASCSGDARAKRRAPARRPAASRSRPRLLDGAAVIVDALLGTGFSGAPREPVGERDRGDQRLRRRRSCACDVPSGVDAVDGRGRRARPCARSRPRRSTPPSRACGSRPARRTPARCASSTSASRRRRAGRRADAGLIDDAALLRAVPAARRGLDEVQLAATCSSRAARAG